MTKKPLLIPLVSLVIIIGGLVYLMNDSQNNNQTPASSSAEQTGVPASITSGGAYIDYSEAALAASSGTKLLFFHAPWCPQCRALEADIKQRGVPEGVTIIKVDYDTNQTLRQKYGVTLQTTIVKLGDNGEMIEKFVAYDNPSLAAIADKLL